MKNARLATIIGFLLVVASLANGSVSYLKRVGWLEHGAYTRFITTYCSGPEGIPCPCMRAPPAGSVRNDFANVSDEKYIYANNGHERLLKLCKDLLIVGFVLFSCYLVQARRVHPTNSAALLPPLLLLANVGVGFLISLYLWGSVFALVGLRSFGFLAIALVGGWVFSGIHGIARYVAALLAVQLILVGIEVFLGIPLRECPNSFRAAGAMVMPNSLGVLTVVGLAFYQSYSSDKLYFWPLVVLSTIILVVAGSGTGMVALLVLLSMIAVSNFSGARKLVLLGVFLLLSAVSLALLPAMTHRPDVYDSVFSPGGRFGTLIEILSESSAMEVLIGRGVGFGTNAATNLIGSYPRGGGFSADSMVTVLLSQLGIIGVILFFGILVWAYRRDTRARPVYLVLAITSLTINITEVFPVNFLLGLTLAGTLSLASAATERTDRRQEPLVAKSDEEDFMQPGPPDRRPVGGISANAYEGAEIEDAPRERC
jgi:hypothetical protein